MKLMNANGCLTAQNSYSFSEKKRKSTGRQSFENISYGKRRRSRNGTNHINKWDHGAAKMVVVYGQYVVKKHFNKDPFH